MVFIGVLSGVSAILALLLTREMAGVKRMIISHHAQIAAMRQQAIDKKAQLDSLAKQAQEGIDLISEFLKNEETMKKAFYQRVYLENAKRPFWTSSADPDALD